MFPQELNYLDLKSWATEKLRDEAQLLEYLLEKARREGDPVKADFVKYHRQLVNEELARRRKLLPALPADTREVKGPRGAY